MTGHIGTGNDPPEQRPVKRRGRVSTQPPIKRLYSRVEAAAYLGVSTWTEEEGTGATTSESAGTFQARPK